MFNIIYSKQGGIYMKKFEMEVIIKGESKRVLVEINEEMIKEAIRVGWESLYFENEDLLAILTLGDRRFTVDVAGDVNVRKDNQLLDTYEIKKLIDDGIDLYYTDGIYVDSNNWFSLNEYRYRYSKTMDRYIWDLEEDVVLEELFDNTDNFINYLIGLF